MSFIGPSYMRLGSGLQKRKDGNDLSTALLLHCDGIDAATTFTNSAVGGAHTVTANGNAQIDTAQSKFGGASGLFDGTGDFLSVPDHADFDLSGGIWTIDCWIRFPTTAVERVLWSSATDGDNYIECQLDSSERIVLIIQAANVNVVAFSPATVLSINTWYHIACIENGNDYYIGIDGALTAASDTDRPANYTGAFEIGRLNEAGNEDYFNGWIDEFRVSKGIARWQQNFPVFDHAYS